MIKGRYLLSILCFFFLIVTGCDDSPANGDSQLTNGTAMSQVEGVRVDPTNPQDSINTGGESNTTPSPINCIPACDGAICGDDGCGNLCGECPSGFYCDTGQCVEGACTANCSGKSCGDDGCGALCGTCPEDSTCIEGACVTGPCEPSCDGVSCGGDGCGGTCGSCEPGYDCEAGECTYNPCSKDPCVVPPADEVPQYCVGTPLCSSDADCTGNWVTGSTCENGVCTQEIRVCEDSSDCYGWCLETYADAYSQGIGFSYCEDQFWECSKANDCPGSEARCIARPKCNTQADCTGSWSHSSTCDGEQCLMEPRHCESESDCYNWCLELYADAYAAGAFTYCEDQVWQCESSNGCPDSPKSCQPLAPCSTDADCIDNWVYTHTCENGACVPQLVDCEEPNACYEGCLDAFETSYQTASEFSYCEDQVWGCQ